MTKPNWLFWASTHAFLALINLSICAFLDNPWVWLNFVAFVIGASMSCANLGAYLVLREKNNEQSL